MGKKAKKNDNPEENNNLETGQTMVKWTTDMYEVLLDALLEEQSKGHRPNGTFSTVAYSNIVKALTAKLNFTFHKNHVKNRIKTLKHIFNTCYELFDGMSGFAWNPATMLFEADNELWAERMKANSAALKWRNTKTWHYDKLLDLSAKDGASGEGGKILQWSMEGGSNPIDLNDESEYELWNLEPISPMDTPQANSQTGISSKSSKNKGPMINVMERQVEVIKCGISTLAEAIKEGNKIAEKGIAIAERSYQHCYSEDEVFAALIDIGAS